jgi:hypothetical protein
MTQSGFLLSEGSSGSRLLELGKYMMVLVLVVFPWQGSAWYRSC